VPWDGGGCDGALEHGPNGATRMSGKGGERSTAFEPGRRKMGKAGAACGVAWKGVWAADRDTAAAGAMMVCDRWSTEMSRMGRCGL
jgi:hypothetical protein